MSVEGIESQINSKYWQKWPIYRILQYFFWVNKYFFTLTTLNAFIYYFMNWGNSNIQEHIDYLYFYKLNSNLRIIVPIIFVIYTIITYYIEVLYAPDLKSYSLNNTIQITAIILLQLFHLYLLDNYTTLYSTPIFSPILAILFWKFFTNEQKNMQIIRGL